MNLMMEDLISVIENSIKKGYSAYDTDFVERTFTIDNLPNFRSYRIKLVMTSTSQELVPQMKNLRVLALVITWKLIHKKVIGISREIL